LIESINLKGLIDVCIITNGRKSYPYALKCLEDQENVVFNLKVIEHMSWIDACNECLNSSNSPFYVRVDDDMLLHPRALEFFNYLRTTDDNTNNVIVNCKLWEVGRRRMISGIKMYNRSLTKEVGFELDKRGKVDKIFRKNSDIKGFKNGGASQSIIGIHAALSIEENMKYVKLRGEDKDIAFKEKRRDLIELDRAFKRVSLLSQVDLLSSEVVQENHKIKSRFSKFLRGIE